ncbi:hypothetical protein ACVBEQ_07180 [Nakamurella sp. GG22]
MNNWPGYTGRRCAGETAADLTEHRVVHRGIGVDLRRLAAVANAIASVPATQRDTRWRAFEEYLTALAVVTTTHLRVDTCCLPRLLRDVMGVPPRPAGDATSRLRKLLDQAQEIVGDHVGQAGTSLSAVLGEAAQVAGRLFDQQERELFPLILKYVRAVDYHRVQEQFRAELPPGMLAFVVPWTMRHATAQELPALTDPALCVTARIFTRRFAGIEALVFG